MVRLGGAWRGVAGMVGRGPAWLGLARRGAAWLGYEGLGRVTLPQPLPAGA